MSSFMIMLGHGRSADKRFNDSGAAANGLVERDLVRGPFLDSMKKYAKMSKHRIVFYETNPFRDKALLYIGADFKVLEVHMDGNIKPDFGGGHVIIHEDLKPDEMDLRIRDVVKRHFGLRFRPTDIPEGISRRGDLQNCNQAEHRGINYRLVELGHITNKPNAAHFVTNYDMIARELLEALTGETVSSERVHVVKDGETLYGISKALGTTVTELINLNSHLVYPGLTLKY